MLKQAPERPRRDLVKKAARAFLLESKQDSLPIDVEALYEPGKYLIFDAEKAEEIAKMGIPIDFWDNDTADAFTCFYKKTKRAPFCLLYAVQIIKHCPR